MKELDRVDLVNSESLPLSRPRIRAILKKMKDNLERGHYEEISKPVEIPKKVYLKHAGMQAERELFGMLIKEKHDR